MDEPAERVGSLDRVGECLLGCVVAFGWQERERSVRARGVGVDREGGGRGSHLIETLGAAGANEPLGVVFACGGLTGVRIAVMPSSLRNTSSKATLNLLSRSVDQEAGPLE